MYRPAKFDGGGWRSHQYPGERQEKTFARAVLYTDEVEHISLKQFREDHHLILGGLGYDIPVLLEGFGVPADHLHVAELNPDLYKRLRQRFPKVETRNEDALTLLARRWKHNFRTLNLDLCNNLSSEEAEWVSSMLRLEAASTATTAVTLHGSREKDWSIKRMIHSKYLGLIGQDVRSKKRCARSLALHARLLQDNDDLNLLQCIPYESRNATHSAAAHMYITTFRFGGRSTPVKQLVKEPNPRELVLTLWSCGVSSTSIAKILHLPLKQVSAWLAMDSKRKQFK